MTGTMIDFERLTLADKELYENYLKKDRCDRGCDFTFPNAYVWGRQHCAELFGHFVIFAQYDRQMLYPFPIGDGDKKPVLDAIIEDAAARGIHCCISGICEGAKDEIERLYPGKFHFHSDEGAFDYVYAIDDLADLAGKKYDGKRNHIARFEDACPNYRCEEINEGNIEKVKSMIDGWYAERKAKNPDADFHFEQTAISKALRHRETLGLDGIALIYGGEVVGVTLGCFLTPDTFDVQFEKAHTDIPGAYAAVNRDFARYIREKYPDVKYLDREDDMGLEGLRRAKKSYHPHHMIKKYWACPYDDEPEE